jgi:hypothetical protein
MQRWYRETMLSLFPYSSSAKTLKSPIVLSHEPRTPSDEKFVASSCLRKNGVNAERTA